MRMNNIHVLTLLASLAAGCGTTKEKQVEAIGKDWAKVIRASQVIPVYPLTEDLHPGDIFLVQTPVDQQQKVWNEDGYLPLDNHLARLHPDSFLNFYEKGFLQGKTNTTLPGDWLRPSDTNQAPWQAAPRVAFPTYGFSVKSGAGMNLAVPVQGVPVGLSVMGTDSANGTISIRDALTVGVDTVSLYEQLKEWAKDHDRLLQAYEPERGGKPKNYLRAITRVYATRQVEIGLADASSRSAGADVGVPKPVELLYADLPTSTTNTATATLTNYNHNLSQLNSGLSGMAEAARAAGKILPGGSVRINAASSRYISLSEAFPKPLVIGYLAFDCAILRGGILGPPVATHATLEGRVELPAGFGRDPVSRIYQDALVLDLYKLFKPGDAAREELDALDQFIPPGWMAYQFDPDTNVLESVVSSADATGKQTGYMRYRSFKGERQNSIGAIADALAEAKFELQNGSTLVQVTKNSDEWRRLSELRDSMARSQASPIEREAVAQAQDRLIRQFLQQIAY